mmetsp:Transcript_40961/g.56953  ORF Transcript_40961/g.56953 Transcript_40961/m.56953 type:complete len:282 (+) Transcript_40961:7621-8466(+)
MQVVTADACPKGWGGHLEPHLQLPPAGGAFKPHLLDLGIEMKEALALLYTLQSYTDHLRGRSIAVRTDNMWLASYLRNEGGNGSAHQRNLSRMVKEIFLWALSNEAIIVDVQWLPSKENVLADDMSRVEDHGNWRVADEVFRIAEEKWGPHTVDRMASGENKKCKRFNSWRFCPGAEAINTFTVDWLGENNWVAPPLAMIPLVLDHIARTGAVATLCIPTWRAMWSPLLDEMRSESIILHQSPAELTTPEANGGQEILKNPLWRLQLVRVKGTRRWTGRNY